MNFDTRSRRVDGLEEAARCVSPPRAPPRVKGRRGAKGFGLRFERQVQNYLTGLPDYGFEASPWFRYRDRNGLGNCQPDGLMHFPDFVVIVEVKASHTIAAYQQLALLYGPVVSLALKKPAMLLEITRHHDPSVHWPVKYALHFDMAELRQWIETRRADKSPMAVLAWKP